MYIMEILEKDQSSEEVMSDRYGHKILTGEFYFRGDYLKLVRSRNTSLRQSELINLETLISLREVFESFAEVNSDIVMSTSMYLLLCERTK